MDVDLIRDGRHYDALKAQNDIPFYLAQAQVASGSILEIGCGTGRVTIPLASAGFDIIGLDVSSSMLEEARRKAEDQGLSISWIQADGVTFDLDRRFALIIMPFNTLQFFRDKATLKQLFYCVKATLGTRDGSFSMSLIRKSPSSLPILWIAMNAHVTQTRMAEERSFSTKRGSTLRSGKSCAQSAIIKLATNTTSLSAV